MDYQTAATTVVKPKLEEIFGAMLGGAIFTSGFVAALKGADDKDKMRILVEAVCTNQQVLAMWGDAQTANQKNQWLALV
ncbi:MAG TPA: hypothetical protein PKL83_00095 [bacterium]|nr:hypothetical protein [bacterium]